MNMRTRRGRPAFRARNLCASWRLIATAAALLAAVPVAADTPAPPAPGIFYGVLPCADCPGVEYHLELFGDGAFYLRTAYQGRKGGPYDDIGSWLRSSDGETLALFGGREAPLRFEIAGPDRLEKLDLEGGPIESGLNYALERDDTRERIEPRLHMRGMFSYFADSAMFHECLTGRRMPVAMEADYLPLEQAYSALDREPGRPVLANLEGRIVERVNMEGPVRPTVIVEDFKGVWPGETCGAKFANADLFETYWKLTRLGDEPVIVGQRQREPFMIFRHGDTTSVSGHAGCNRFTGAVDLDASALEFGMLAATRMACPDAMQQEQAFLQALGEARRWNIVGQHLELFDAEGRLLARFEAVYLK